MLRIGFDIGGSKIAAIALDQRGREVARLRRDVPRDYPTTLAALAELSAGLQHEPRPRPLDRHRHAWSDRRRRRADPGGQPALARRPSVAAGPERRAAGPGRDRQRRQLPCPVGGGGRRRRRSARSVRRDPGHRGRRRHRGRGQGADRRQRDRRRMGPQPAAGDAPGGWPAGHLWVRPDGLHRDLARRRRAGAGLPKRRRRREKRSRRRASGRGRRARGAQPRSRATSAGWPRRWPA